MLLKVEAPVISAPPDETVKVLPTPTVPLTYNFLPSTLEVPIPKDPEETNKSPEETVKVLPIPTMLLKVETPAILKPPEETLKSPEETVKVLEIPTALLKVEIPVISTPPEETVKVLPIPTVF